MNLEKDVGGISWRELFQCPKFVNVLSKPTKDESL
jgi:hypothetical protein